MSYMQKKSFTTGRLGELYLMLQVFCVDSRADVDVCILYVCVLIPANLKVEHTCFLTGNSLRKAEWFSKCFPLNGLCKKI